MSIASEITRLQNIKTNIRSALVTQGVPAASGHDMADFSADILSISTGGGATITVTYSSEFYNKTMTCTKGTKTYTKTTTSSGSTVFNVDEEGTWTITCNGVSRQVDVVLEYSTQMAITKTVTVYSAASDTVSFTDSTGAKTVTTNASGQGSVNITFIPPSQNITFTSSVAKNPSNLSQAYSKTITMTDSVTSVYVMPDKVLYWWGFIKTVANIGFNLSSGATAQTNGISMNSGGQGIMTDTITAPVPTAFHCIFTTTVTTRRSYQYGYGTSSSTAAFTGGTGREKFAEFNAYDSENIHKYDASNEYIAVNKKFFLASQIDAGVLNALWYD